MIHPGESHHSCFIFFNRWEVQNCWFNMRIFTSAELSSNGTFQKIFFKSLSVMIFLTFNIKLIFNITPMICINICCEHWVKIYWGLTLTFFSEIFVRRESFSSWLVNEPENILHLFPGNMLRTRCQIPFICCNRKDNWYFIVILNAIRCQTH